MLKSYFKKGLIEAGCDEAGRGCLAGPVYAASVILPSDYKNKILNDSKQISEKNREILRIEIEKEAIDFGVGIVDNIEIDEINILNASFLAMHRSVDELKIIPELLLIDGNRFNPYPNINHECIIKGDAKFLSIAAASILAKTYRDDFMFAAHNKHPEYAWNRNKGYPTKVHRAAIRKIGTTDIHRMTFRLLPE
ncbi:MAG: ribonuclease HII [Flavobacteriales bacterium]|jgi:ribonuclease HII|tara:strand:+ start:497 stop:1078 length:582 start_codon:yes stop_codon:yes gene_type:complete